MNEIETKQLIDELVSDHQKFNDFVYTNVHDAIRILDERRTNRDLCETTKKSFTVELPDFLRHKKLAVHGIHVATPNYEVRRFVNIVDALEELSLTFFEYYNDKFTDNNERKYNLGRIHFYMGRHPNGGERNENFKIVNFDEYRGKKISSVKTLWGQPLVDFHHEFLANYYHSLNLRIPLLFDASEWLRESGGDAIHYYENMLRLFLTNGILFENFLTDFKEIRFTKEVFLPAFMQIYNDSGCKPLIVALEPTQIESDHFWMCYPPESKNFVLKKLKIL